VKCTSTGRVVYSRKKHYYDGYALLRCALSFESADPQEKPMDFMFLALTMMHLVRILGTKELLPSLATVVIRLDPARMKIINKYDWGKRPKKWRIYEEFRDMVIHRWETGTLQSAWKMVVFSLDLLDSFTRIFIRIRAILQLIF